MPALIALFAILGIPFHAEWIPCSSPTGCYMVGSKMDCSERDIQKCSTWESKTQKPKPHLSCEVVYVIPAEQGKVESLEEALAEGDGEWISICRAEEK